MSHACVLEWHKKFSEGQQNLKDNEHSRTEENVEQVSQIIE